MIYSHKGYQCLLLPRVSKKSVQWSCKPKSSDSMEQQAFVTWSRAKLIVDIDILQAKQKFTSLVELFLQERSTEFPLYPRPEMPDATIEAIVGLLCLRVRGRWVGDVTNSEISFKSKSL